MIFSMVVALKCGDTLRPRRYNHVAELLQPGDTAFSPSPGKWAVYQFEDRDSALHCS
jgi:hypothetical protein